MPSASPAGVSRPECESFLSYLADERNDSPNTVKAYRRDLDSFQDFCDDYFAHKDWTWESIDRLALRTNHGGVQGLVIVVFRVSDVVVKLAGQVRPQVMHGS